MKRYLFSFVSRFLITSYIYNHFSRKWVKDSYEFYDNIRKSDCASYAGVTDISGYIFANSSPHTVQVKII